MTRFLIRRVTALLILMNGMISVHAKSPIFIMELPEGELAWSTERPKKAKMCVPAAFTDKEGKVEGEYRLHGKIHLPNKKRKVSIGNGTFYIDGKWHTDSGFQQYALVLNNKARTFDKDKNRKFVRRALCKKGGKTFLVQSRRRMTLNDFAKECAKVSSDAVYLDMGIYGYGYIGKKDLSLWAYFYRNRQTNWIYIK